MTSKKEASLIIKGVEGESRFVLNEKKILTVGSSMFSNVTLKGSEISRKHIKFYYINNCFMAEGISKNFITINGDVHKAAKLNNGDVIQLGVYEILFYHIQKMSDNSAILYSEPSSDKVLRKQPKQIKLTLERDTLVTFERVKTQVKIIYSSTESNTVTSGFEWQIEPSELIMINEENELLPLKTGLCRVGVKQGDLFDIVDVEIKNPDLEEMSIIVPDELFFDGEVMSLEVLGRFSGVEMRERPVTHLVEWSCDQPQLIDFFEDTDGMIKAKSPGVVKVRANYGETAFAEAEIKIQPAVLKRLNIRLESKTIEAGTQVPVFIEGVLSNGHVRPYSEDVIWNVEGSPSIKIENNFVIQAIEPGRCELKALTSFLESNVITINVTVSQVKQGTLFFPDQISPGSKINLTLRVLSANGHAYDVTALAKFKIDNPMVLRLHSNKVLEGMTEGYATVSAYFNDQEYIKTVQVTENPMLTKVGDDQYVDLVVKALDKELPIGQASSVIAVALNSNGSQLEIPSDELILKSLTPNILQEGVDSVVATSEGEGLLQVVWRDRVVECSVNVVPARIVKIKFETNELKLFEGHSAKLRAFGMYSNGREIDITEKCLWKIPKAIKAKGDENSIMAYKKGDYKITCHFANIKKILNVFILSEEDSQIEDDASVYGDLRITDVLGQGGMGKVFLAKHVVDNKLYAIKAIRERFLNDSHMLESFIAEAQILHRFHHPNIVKVYSYGWKDNQPYMVMEYLKGMTLSEIIKTKGALSVAKAVAVIRDVSRALHVIHSGRDHVVHRDIKPGNIFLTEEGVVKLMDFGITLEQNPDKGSTLTLIRGMGTANYMSPEQGKRKINIDTRSDIYSLGATFYALLTARPPFSGATNLEIILKHVNEIPKKLEDIMDVPKEVNDLVAKMLRKNPAKRPQTAGEITMILELISSEVDLRECFF